MRGRFRRGFAGDQSSRMADVIFYPPFSQRKHESRQWVGTSSWQDGEAAVHRRLTLERLVPSTLLPECAIKPPAAEAEQFASAVRQVSERSRRLGGCYAVRATGSTWPLWIAVHNDPYA